MFVNLLKNPIVNLPGQNQNRPLPKIAAENIPNVVVQNTSTPLTRPNRQQIAQSVFQSCLSYINGIKRNGKTEALIPESRNQEGVIGISLYCSNTNGCSVNEISMSNGTEQTRMNGEGQVLNQGSDQQVTDTSRLLASMQQGLANIQITPGTEGSLFLTYACRNTEGELSTDAIRCRRSN